MWHWNAPANLINQPARNGGAASTPTRRRSICRPRWRIPAGSDYQLLLRDIDAIAVELQKFEDAGVPVIWRPLHEAQGGWFWWGAHGPETFKELWHLTYDRLTNHHGLHNLIWEFTSSAAEGNHLDWYPGDDVVDMIGLDIYTDPSATMSGQWYDMLEHYNGRKMIAVSETDTLVESRRDGPVGHEMELRRAVGVGLRPMSEYANAGYSQAQLSAILQQFLEPRERDHAQRAADAALEAICAGRCRATTTATAPSTRRTSPCGAIRSDETGTSLAADGDGDGVIGDGDYAVWKLFFGESHRGARECRRFPSRRQAGCSP